MGISDKLLAEVKALIDEGKNLHAVKKMVAEGDMGLREAKHYVDTMHLDNGTIKRPKILKEFPEDLEKEIRELMFRGRRVFSIKKVRDITGVDKAKAAEYVDAIDDMIAQLG